MSVAAVVVAAGRGERLGGSVPKAFVPLAGRPLLAYSLEALAAVRAVERVVPVLAPRDRGRWDAVAAELGGMPKLAAPVGGGARRQDSVGAGLAALGGEATWVLVHDAARPLVRAEAVERVLEAARRDGAAILASPARDTLKRVREGRVLDTPPRSELWGAQTPQAFAVALLREALAKAEADGFTGTDDAQLVERLGAAVAVVPGDPDNLKITDPADLVLAELLLRERQGSRPRT